MNIHYTKLNQVYNFLISIEIIHLKLPFFIMIYKYIIHPLVTYMMSIGTQFILADTYRLKNTKT
jgi:hypothetical protein